MTDTTTQAVTMTDTDIKGMAAGWLSIGGAQQELALKLLETRETISTLLAERDTLAAQLAAAQAALERDRTKVAETINAVHSEISGRQWLLTGRGPYEWDDDRYRSEFADALKSIREPINSLRSIARDWSNCPTDPETIKKARHQEAYQSQLAVENAALIADAQTYQTIVKQLTAELDTAKARSALLLSVYADATNALAWCARDHRMATASLSQLVKDWAAEHAAIIEEMHK